MKRLFTLILFCFVAVTLAGCIATKARVPQHDATSLYRNYFGDDQTIHSLKGRPLNVTGKITRIDLSAGRSLFIELDQRVIVFLRNDEVEKIGKMGLMEGDIVSLLGTFQGKSMMAQWSTGADEDVLILEEAEIVGRQSWLSW